jgi:uncharacterized membrane protein (GlpM family)
MGPLDSLNHVLNFLAPAFCVALLTVIGARILMKKGAKTPRMAAQFAINFVFSALVLLAGLWLFGHDGKMATYAALVLACASVQAWMLRGARR